MKRTITLFLILLAFVSQGFGQAKSQRLVLVEEFTNASCGPCANYNPAFNALLQQPSNLSKIIAIKYQTDWPGYDPMNVQTAAEVDQRVSYYSVPYVPYGVLDGNVWQNNPSGFGQSHINSEYAVASPFTMSVTHHLSPDCDSVYITVVVTATEAISGTLVLQTAILEKTIEFASAPGTNGETEFFNVMRKMLPNPSGTSLPGTWAVNDVQTYNFSVPLPSYIYNFDQVYVIAWVQDNANKNVKQAGISEPNTTGVNMAVESVTGLPEMTCSLPLTAHSVIKNNGLIEVTSCKVKYQMGTNAVDSLVWTGTLATNDTFQVHFNGLTPTFGDNEFKVWVTDINGGSVDVHGVDNLMSAHVILANQSFAVPVFSSFESSVFPPANWFIVNPGGDNYKWNRVTTAGGFGQTAASARIQFYSIPEGGIDEFYLSPADLSTASAAVLTFNVAHARYSASYSDRLQVQVSTDCGATWTTPYDKQDPALATTSTLYTSAFTPTAQQWRNESVDMNAYAGQQQVMVKFVAVSGYGNNLFIDDVNLTTAVGINEQGAPTSFEVFPNPVSNMATLSLNLAKAGEVSLEVYNAFGQMVYKREMGNMTAGQYTTTFDGSQYTTGFYYINLILDGEKIVKKISVAR